MRILGVTFALLALLSLTHVSALTFECPLGTTPITSATRELATKAGIPESASCWTPTDTHTGLAVAEAKQYLLSIARGLPGTQAPPTAERIEHLNPAMAVCSANFLKAYSERYGPVVVRSAFRCGPNSPAHIDCDRTENRRAGGADGSNHQLGLALDVNPLDGNYPQLWTFARQNPEFGVCFPYLSGDRPHLALAGTGTGEAARCAAQGVTQMCSGVSFDPVSVPPWARQPRSFDEGDAMPLSGNPFGNPLTQGLQPPPPPPQTPISQQIAPPQPITQPQESASTTRPSYCLPRFSCTGTTMYYHTSSCTEQEYRTCPYGCDGDRCADAPATTTPATSTSSSTSAGTSTSVSSDPSTSPTSGTTRISDLIEAYARGFGRSTESGTSTPVTLNESLRDVVGLGDTSVNPINTGQVVVGIDPSAQLPVEQTFSAGGSMDVYRAPIERGFTEVVADFYRTAAEWLRTLLRTLSPH